MNKVAVFVCHCGKNIAGEVDVEEVVEYASTLPGVVVAKHNKYLCSSSGQKMIKEVLAECDANAVVVAACSPRMHENLFRNCIEEVGLNPYMLEMANIREHCSWVHRGREATEKAKALVRMAVAKAWYLEPLEKKRISLIDRAMVIGGGVSGIQAALDLAEQGFEVYLVERNPSIGGHMAQLDKTFPTLDCSICILGPKMVEAYRHERIHVITYAEIESVDGYVGNFKVRVRKKARFVTDACTGCGVCAEHCPVEVDDEFNCGLSKRKAIYLPFPQSVPLVYTIDPAACMGCGICEDVCLPKAIDYEQRDEIEEIEVGAIIVATGYDLFDPSNIPEYGYGVYENVITSMEFERLINASGPTGGKVVLKNGEKPKSIAFIQCVGSRGERGEMRKYCSGVCCMYSIKHAIQIKEKNPETDVCIFYMDIRTVGKGYEEFYWRAREMGVRFVRGRPAKIEEFEAFEDGKAVKKLKVIAEDTLTGRIRKESFDMVVLAPAMLPAKGAEELRKKLGIAADSSGFFMEAHAKLRPVDTAIAGIYIAGCAHSPKDIPTSVAQGSAAASRVATLLSKGAIEVDPITAYVIPELCFGCGLCKEICDFNAIDLSWGKAYVRPNCTGCGGCVAACPTGALQMGCFTDRQIIAQIENAFDGSEERPRILAFLCNWCSYGGADSAGLARLKYPANVRAIRVMCSARVDPVFVLKAFLNGADGVIVAGCHLGDCHYLTGNYKAKNRVEKLWQMLDQFGINRERLLLTWISASEGEKFAKTMREFTEKVSKLPPAESEVENLIKFVEEIEKEVRTEKRFGSF